MHRVVEDQLKYDVEDNPRGEQVADVRHAASQEFSSVFSMEEQTVQIGRLSRFSVGKAAANPQDDDYHGLQDEA